MIYKHTPGPWPVRDELITSIGQGASICRVMTANQDWQANARLISAAPDLLTALETVIYSCDNDLQGTDKPRGLEQARAAIARARGES